MECGHVATRTAGLFVAALGLGVFADLGHDLPGSLGLVPQLAGPWLALAFAAGWCIRRLRWAAPAGVSAISAAFLTYLGWKSAAYGAESNAPLRASAEAWVGLAIVVGAAFGVAGSMGARGRSRASGLGWGAMVGGVLAEAVAVILMVRLGDAAGVVVGIGEAIVAAVLGSVLLLRGTPWLPFSVGTSAVAVTGFTAALLGRGYL